MDARAIIAAIRNRQTPDAEALGWFAQGLANGSVSDAQAGAFAMAVCLNGLSDQGSVALTRAMRDSGDVLSWDLPGPVLDKHSTGGVGDCVSLIAAPVLAACGAYVPMISGRGLGHTGGTLDKLEAIPGLSTQVTEQHLRQITREVGCAIVSATGQIAPADRRLYAIRDVTATVDSIDLITASILSKKLAAGLDGLILDVKCGSGAFMKTPDDARALAQALVSAANGAGCRTAALITDMNAPLAPALGNAVEVAVCMEVLEGNSAAAPRLAELTKALCVHLLTLQGRSAPEASAQVALALSSGEAMERFARMIAAMGGPPDMAEDWRTHLPAAPIMGEVTAPDSGHITAIDGEALGLVVVGLGGGRRIETDRINPSVGLTDMIGLGASVTRGQPLCTLHAATEEAAIDAARAVRAAITIGAAAVPGALVLERIG
ncbi:thymidine phosphorylase [Yoonia vestfoldensis]|uniref:Thymidine phosphorylase n=1 Tax=Yoonia vestfoldensis SKA53 TaxID=314232 RepID=A3V1L2_9RHOB|nr:thymidine phosphorylase [Yoonia vestfoldensis]EAQ07923.1 thymidine phosphorylase [Yoonia vestfoldensis SKA53]